MSPETKPLVERVEHFEVGETTGVPEDPDSIWRMPIKSSSQFVQIQLVAAGLSILNIIPFVIIVTAVLAVFGPRRWRWLYSCVLGYFALGVMILQVPTVANWGGWIFLLTTALLIGAVALCVICARAQYGRAMKEFELASAAADLPV